MRLLGRWGPIVSGCEHWKGKDMKRSESAQTAKISRRDFLHAAGSAAAGISLSSGQSLGAAAPARSTNLLKGSTTVRGAFIYPPTESLREAGYYSWPGSGFDAEERQKQYMERIKKIEQDLEMRISMNETPLDDAESVTRFIGEVKQSKPDGLLLVLFKKGHWGHVTRIVEETKIPTVVLATLGILLVEHINQLHRKPGVYLINSLDNLDAVQEGMKMIRTGRRMRDSLIASIGDRKSVG
jgi:hypothetical protein